MVVIKTSFWSPVPKNHTFLFDGTELELILRMNNMYKLLPCHRRTNLSLYVEFLRHTKLKKPSPKLNIYYSAQ